MTDKQRQKAARDALSKMQRAMKKLTSDLRGEARWLRLYARAVENGERRISALSRKQHELERKVAELVRSLS